jgi:hypothetical protein
MGFLAWLIRFLVGLSLIAVGVFLLLIASKISSVTGFVAPLILGGIGLLILIVGIWFRKQTCKRYGESAPVTEENETLMGYLFRWLRIVIASPFLALGLLLLAFRVHGAYVEECPFYVPPWLFYGFLSLVLGVVIFPKKGLFRRDHKGGTNK